jgi:hypothetical protein
MRSAASPFIVDDAIVGLAQPLTEALNQLASGPRRACDLIEELARREDFYLDLAGGSSGRTAGAVFHNAHLAYELSRANRAKKYGVAIEFPEYVDSTAEQVKNAVRRFSLSEEDLPLGEVRASHCDLFNRRGRLQGPISTRSTILAIRGIQPPSIQSPPSECAFVFWGFASPGPTDHLGRLPRCFTLSLSRIAGAFLSAHRRLAGAETNVAVAR